ncbi:MAG TPA: sugar phosphate isomerase/epimerase, partial [Candidatus Brocadiia bacterium]|nr:sugar phosphate isomerase/epimerase [Candidatus Brocadiia bacterium]
MKLGVMSAIFSSMGLKGALDQCKRFGLECIELGTGAYPGNALCDAAKLLKDKKALAEFKAVIADSGVEISALSCHGNPLHPDKKLAMAHQEVHRNSVKLAKLLGVKVVINFSGCPGGCETDKRPNWVTCPWPEDYGQALAWQWEKRVIPFWKAENKFAEDNGVKLAFEMHPGFVVYNTETMLRLRSECGKAIGANFDPSH